MVIISFCHLFVAGPQEVWKPLDRNSQTCAGKVSICLFPNPTSLIIALWQSLFCVLSALCDKSSLLLCRTDNAAKNRFGALSKGTITYSSCTPRTSVVRGRGSCGKAEGEFNEGYQTGVKHSAEGSGGKSVGRKKSLCLKLSRGGASARVGWGGMDGGGDGGESKKSPASSVDNGTPRPRSFDLNFPACFLETCVQ